MKTLALILLTATLVSVGCASGPISATSAHLARFEREGKQRVNEQVLTIDLPTGRATLSDPNGSVYPSQLPPELAEQWRDAINSGKWMTAPINPPRKAQDVQRYELSAFDGEAKVGKTAQWSVPSANPLPPPLDLFTQTFNRLDRMAHPISDKVNLLE